MHNSFTPNRITPNNGNMKTPTIATKESLPHITKNFIYGSMNALQALRDTKVNFNTIFPTEFDETYFSFNLDCTDDLLEIVPSLTINTAEEYHYRVLIEGFSATNSASTIIDIFDESTFSTTDQSFLKNEIDSVLLNDSFSSIKITLELNDVAIMAESDWLFSIACKYKQRNSHFTLPTQTTISNQIPALSQMAIPEIGDRICSATCVSMILTSYKRYQTPLEIAEKCYSKKFDLYGIWPLSLYVASYYRTVGVLLSFDNWDDVINTLNNGYALVTSIRYGKGELSNCALERPDSTPKGHLVVLKGIKNDTVLVNDPAANNLDEVERYYNLEEFSKIWLSRAAIAYLIIPQEKLLTL